MSAVVDWFSSLGVIDWISLVGAVFIVLLTAALVRDYERLRKQQEADRARIVYLEDEMRKAKRSMQAMARKVNRTDGTTLIPIADRPTPAQVPPTIPGLSSARPQPTPRQQPEPTRTGATAVGGRHRTPPKRKAS